MFHGQANAVALFIHTKNNDFYDVADLHSFAGMAESAVGYFGNMHQTILMDTDIHENTEINDVTNCTGQLHALFQVFHFQNILAQNGGGKLLAGIPSGLGQFLCNVGQSGLTNTAVGSSFAQTVFVQFFADFSSCLFVTAQQLQQLLCSGIGFRMDTGIVENFLAFRNPEEAGCLLKGLGSKLWHFL